MGLIFNTIRHDRRGGVSGNLQADRAVLMKNRRRVGARLVYRQIEEANDKKYNTVFR